MSKLTTPPKPNGELCLQTIAMPADTNPNGDIFGGWLMSQMDIAAYILSGRVAKGRTTTVAVNKMIFLHPVPVGAAVSCYCELLHIGNSSMQIAVEAWINDPDNKTSKVTEAEFVFVAIDDEGNTRSVPQ